jgi:hypothetical protein
MPALESVQCLCGSVALWPIFVAVIK